MTSLKWDPARTVADNAREKLPLLARQFFIAGRQAAGKDVSFELLHRFRLTTKRFRYTLELFDEYYGPELESRLEELQAVQQILGEINDCATTKDLLLDRDDVSEPERDRLLRKIDRRAAAKVAAFRRLWRTGFAAPARERSWIRYLGG